MGLYRMTNVPVRDEKRAIKIEVTEIGEIILWSADARDPENREHWWRITDIYLGDHMFEPDKRQLARKCYGDDVVYALQRGIELGYAKAQADIRQALGVKP